MSVNLDPTTNLPENRETSSGPLTVDQLTRNREATMQAATPTPVQGTFGRYARDANISPDINFNELRAQGQSGWQILGRSAMNAVFGVILGEGIASIGYMADAPGYMYRALSDAPGDITDEKGTLREGRKGQPYERNFLSKFGHTISDYFFDNFEVYQTEQAQEGGINPFKSGSRVRDATFWGANAPSVVSSLTLMIPSFAAARGARLLAGAMGLQQSARAAKSMEVIGSALLSRHNYNMMEGYDLMDRQVELYQDRGYLYSDAKNMAALDAGRFYSTGYLNLWKDMIQWTALLRGAKYAQNTTRRTAIEALKRNPSDASNILRRSLERGRSITQAAKDSKLFTPLNVLTQAGLEGIEEFNIQFQKNWSARNADILYGLQDGETKGFWESYFSGDIMEELRNPETQNAMLMAFMGGPFIQGAFSGINYSSNRKIAAQMSQEAMNHSKSINLIKEKLAEIEHFAATGNDVAAQKAQDDLVAAMALTGIITESGEYVAARSEDSLEVRKALFEAVQELSDTELQELGLTPEARENSKRIVKELNRVQEIHRKNVAEVTSEIPDVVAAFLTEEQYMTEKANERKAVAEQNVESVFDKAGIKELTNKEGVSKAKIKREGRLYALKEYQKRRIELRDKILSKVNNPLRHKLIKKRYDETTQYLTDEIAHLEQQGKEDPTNALERTVISRIKNEAEWNQNNYQAVSEEINIREGEANAADYITDSFAEDFNQIVKLQNEELEAIINKYFFEKAIPEDSVITHDGKPHVISHEEAGTVIRELDPTTHKPIGKAIPMTAEMWNQDVVGKPLVKLEDLVSTEDKEQVIKDMQKDLDNNDFMSFINKLSRLSVSGFAKETTASSRQLLKSFKDWAEKIDNPKAIINAGKLISDHITSEQVKKSIQDIIDSEKKRLIERYERELAALEKATAPTVRAVQSTRNKIESINKEIDALSESVKEYTPEQMQQEVTQARESLEAQRTQELTGLEGVEAAVVNKKYDDLIQSAIIRIFDKGSQTNRQIKEKLAETKKKKQELLESKKQFENALENYEHALDVYEQVKKKFVNLYEYESDMSMIGITEEALETLGKDIDITYLEALFESQSLGELNIKESVKTLQGDIDAGLTAIDKMIDGLEAVIGVNTILQTAMKNAYHKLLTENFDYINPANFTGTLVNRYKQLLLSEIAKTRPSEKLTQHQLRGLNMARIELQRMEMTELAYRDVVPQKAFDFLMSEAREAFADRVQKRFDETSQNLSSLYRDIRILTTLQKSLYKKFAEKKQRVKENKSKPKEKSEAKKILANVWTTQAGNTLGDKNSKVVPAYNVRYTKAVNNINPFNPETPVTIMVIKPEEYEIEVPDNVRERHKDQPIFFGVAVKEEGDGTVSYYKEDGTTTPEFNLEESVYNPMPAVKTEIEYLEKGQKPELEAEYQKQHQKLVDDWSKGENTLLQVHTKSQGVTPASALMKNARDYNEATPNLAKDVLGENLNIITLHDSQVSVEGFVYKGKKGDYVHYDKETGNFFEIVTRRMNKEEVDTIVKWLEGYSKKVTFGLKGIPQFKSTQLDVEGITATDIVQIKEQFSFRGQLDIKLKENKIVIQGEEVQILATDAKGKMINELHNVDRIKGLLQESLVNISSAKYKKNETFTPIRYKDGKFTEGTPISYKDYTHNELAHTWRTKTQPPILLEGGVNTPAPALFNQQFRFEHPYISEAGIESTQENKKTQEINAPEYTKKSFKDFEPPSIPEMDAETIERFERVPDIDDAGPQIDLSQIPDTPSENEVVWGGEQVSETPAPKIGLPDITIKEAEEKSKVEDKTAGPPKAVTDFISKMEDSDFDPELAEKKAREQKKRSDAGEADFQRSSTSRILTTREKSKLTNTLSKRTGINFQLLDSDQALYMLEHIREQGVIKEHFTKDNLPSGMYYNGVAYSFGEVTLDTPFHEISHPIVNQIIADNPQLFETLQREVVKHAPEIIERVMKNYPDPTDSQGNIKRSTWAEIITTAIGEDAAGKYDARQQGLVNAIKRMWEAIRQYFRNLSGEAIHINQLSPTTTIAQLGSILGETSQRIILTPSSIERQYQKNIPSKESIDFGFRAIEMLQSDKSKKVFKKALQNNWTLEKTLNEIGGFGKKTGYKFLFDQNLLDKGLKDTGMNIEDFVLDILTKLSFTVDMNVKLVNNILIPEGQKLNARDTHITYSAKGKETVKYEKEPGWKYVAFEFATPFIDPSIKGHAGFSTSQGIGWTRTWHNSVENILEVQEIQSDLFQAKKITKFSKPQIKKGLKFKTANGKEYVVQEDFNPRKPHTVSVKRVETGEVRKVDTYKLEALLNRSKITDKSDSFLKFLYQKDRWAEFFVKSIMQYAAKNGIETVRFPTGETALNIQSHPNIEVQLKQQKRNLETFTKRIEDFQGEKGMEKIRQDYEYDYEALEGFPFIKEEVAFIEGERRTVYGVYVDSEIGAELYDHVDTQSEAQELHKKLMEEYTERKKEAKEALRPERLEQVRQEKIAHYKEAKEKTQENIEALEKGEFITPIPLFYEKGIAKILNNANYSTKKVSDSENLTWQEVKVESEMMDTIALQRREFTNTTTQSGQTLQELGISQEKWYILPDSVKEHILHCN